MRLFAQRPVASHYEIQPEDLAEIASMEAEGWVFVHAEHDLSDLGKATGLVDVASQCALGNREEVLVCDLDALCKATQQAVELRLYFVEQAQLEASKREREREQRQRSSVRSAHS